MHDLVIRGATVVDGLGHDPIRADVAVTDGSIAAIGEIGSDVGFGLYLLGHWVRERGAFDLQEGVRRLTGHQAGLYGIPDRGHIAVGARADLLLFDPATVGVSPPRRVPDLPAGGTRTLRDPVEVHGVFVNGVRVFDGKKYARLDRGPGRVLDRFLPARGASQRSAALANAAK